MPLVKPLIELSRPGNVLITALAVIVGGLLPIWSLTGHTVGLLWAAVSAALVAAGGNAYNDFCDRDLDRLQKPDRPLPSGRVSRSAALIWAGMCFTVGLLIAAALGVALLSIAAIACLLLVIYSRFLKRLPLVGNVAVALVAALAFVYGGAAVGKISAVRWAAWVAFLFHLGREIIKDVEDREGDAAAGASTLPVRFGLPAARWSASLIFLLLAISLPLPYYVGGYQLAYLVVALLCVLPVLLITAILTWIWIRPSQFGLLSSVLKWDMVVGLLALYSGRPLPGGLA